MYRYIFLTLCFAFFTSAWASEKQYSIRGVYGWATIKDLGDILLRTQMSPDHKEYELYSLDVGKLLYADVNDWPVDIYAKSGLTYYNENNFDTCYGIDSYLKAFYNFDFLANRVRFGLGEGLSYTTKLLQIEKKDSINKHSPTSKFLNYLDISLDFDIGKFMRSKALEELYLGALIKHRSGVFGLFNGVHGGSNYLSLYIEKNF